MDPKSTTVQASLVSLGDLWFGDPIVGVANTWPATDVAITTRNGDGINRTTVIRRDAWISVMRAPAAS
jgi:hypothetical protein